MENENKLSVFGWLIILAIFASICYWFSIPVGSELTLVNAFNALLKSLILIILFIIMVIAWNDNQHLWIIQSSIVIHILVLDAIISDWNDILVAFHNDYVSLFQGIYIMVLSVIGALTVVFNFIKIVQYIAKLMDPETGKLQALKDSLKQNLVTKLMFKQHKQEKHVEKVKI